MAQEYCLKLVSEGIEPFLGLTVNIENGSRYPSKRIFLSFIKVSFAKTVKLNVVAEPLEEKTSTVAKTVPQCLFSFARGFVHQTTLVISTFRPYCGLG